MIRKDLWNNTFSKWAFIFSFFSMIVGGIMVIRPIQVFIFSKVYSGNFNAYEGIVYLLLGVSLLFQFISTILRKYESKICLIISAFAYCLSNVFSLTYSIVNGEEDFIIIILNGIMLALSFALLLILYFKDEKTKISIVLINVNFFLYFVQIILSYKSFISGFITNEMTSDNSVIYILVSIILLIPICLSTNFNYSYIQKT